MDQTQLYWLTAGSIGQARIDGSAAGQVVLFDLTAGSSSSGPLPEITYALDSSFVYFTQPMSPDIRRVPR